MKYIEKSYSYQANFGSVYGGAPELNELAKI